MQSMRLDGHLADASRDHAMAGSRSPAPASPRRRFRRIGAICIAIAVAIAAAACGEKIGHEPWRTSWPQFVTAIDAFRKDAEEKAPDAPDFPSAGAKMMAEGGEPLPADWPVMRTFGGLVEFHGVFRGVESELPRMSGQPFSIRIAFEGGAAVVPLIYPRTAQTWRNLAPGTPVRFRAHVSGIAAYNEASGAIGLILMAARQKTERRLDRPSYPFRKRYVYYVLLTDAEIVSVRPNAPP